MYALLAAGCDQVFGLDPRDDGDVLPIQEVTASIAADKTFPFTVRETSAGNTLIAIFALRTQILEIEELVDSAGNVWSRVVNGPDTLAPGDPGRLEIWYMADAAPITMVTVRMREDRAMAVSFTEWSSIAPVLPVITTQTPPAGRSTTPASGQVTTMDPALVIAATVFPGSSVTPSVATSGFTPFSPFVQGELNSSAVFAAVPEGTYEAAWTLPDALAWTAGIVAFRLK